MLASCVRHFFACGPEVVWLHAPCGTDTGTYTLAYGQPYDLHKCPKAQCFVMQALCNSQSQQDEAQLGGGV